MKTGIRVTVYALLAMILFSCEHKELCFHHPHMVTLRVDFDWKNAPQADPEGMCVYFYPEEGESPIRFDFAGKDGGSVEIKEGRYRILCYNNDTESLLFRGMEGFDTHEYLDILKEENSEEFRHEYMELSEKYALPESKHGGK